MRVACFLLGCALVACAPDPTPPPTLTHDELLDAKTCSKCHADHYQEWSGSMHAYAAQDPLFLAMNRRGQRETNGALGNFCINCHAPMAVRTGATKDGLNLDQVDEKLKGVTCYFCHSVSEVTGAHNAPLTLGKDDVMRGPFADPLANTAHQASYSALHDRDQLTSSSMCGSCHDITTPLGAPIERTYAEWQESVFSHAPAGTTCGQCHMAQSTDLVPIAQVANAPKRRSHAHTFAGVDLALEAFPEQAAQKQAVQDSLNGTLQSAVCVEPLGTDTKIQVILDNVAAGHAWPSGSSQDRRAWVEVVAKAAGETVYSSGVVPQGTSVTALDDPDLWLLRDCLFDGQGHGVNMFWQAASYEGNALPALATFNVADPRYYQTHLMRAYPGAGRHVSAQPDEVHVRVHLMPVGLDVVDDLIASGDLDPKYRTAISELLVGQPADLVWTPQTATQRYVDRDTDEVYTCVSNTGLNVNADRVVAPGHAKCSP